MQALKYSIVIVIVLFGFIASCTGTDTIVPLTALEAKSLIDQHETSPQFVILDIRTPQEFAQGHIAGAVNLDYYSRDFSKNLEKLDKSKTYLMYCRSGNRSGRTLAIVDRMGFNKIYHLKNGIVEWQAKKLPLVGSQAG